MARFRKKRRKNYRGGSVSIQAHEDGQSQDDILAQKNASDVEAANAQLLRNKIGGGKRKRRNQIGGSEEGETYVAPSSANASPQGNKSMGDAAELQAQNQANQKYEGGGRRRTRRKRSRRRKKTKRRRRRKSKRKRKTRRRRKRR